MMLSRLASLLAVVATVCVGCSGTPGSGKAHRSTLTPELTATNRSVPGKSVWDYNVNIPITGKVKSFFIEASRPVVFAADQGLISEDLSRSSSFGDTSYPFSAARFQLLDDKTKFEAVRENAWWQASGMSVTLDGGEPRTDIHYIVLSRLAKTSTDWFPNFLVLYCDGNLLLTQSPGAFDKPCFGSSVIVGPAAICDRPFAEIASVNYVSATDSLEISYKDGSSATLKIISVNYEHTLVRVTFNTTSELPLITFRSMYKEPLFTDVDHAEWTGPDGVYHDDEILKFRSGTSADWLFYRHDYSRHQFSSSDIRIGQ